MTFINSTNVHNVWLVSFDNPVCVNRKRKASNNFFMTPCQHGTDGIGFWHERKSDVVAHMHRCESIVERKNQSCNNRTNYKKQWRIRSKHSAAGINSLPSKYTLSSTTTETS